MDALGVGFDPGSPFLSGGGMAAFREILTESNAFLKALTSGGGETDIANLIDGGALRRESLEPQLIRIVSDRKHYTAIKLFAGGKATAVVDSWTRHTDHGGFYEGGGAQGELDTIREADAVLAREYDQVKMIATRRRVGYVSEIESANGLASSIVVQTNSGIQELLRSINWLAYYGRKDCNPFEFNGLAFILETAGQVLDMEGGTISSDFGEFHDAAARVAGVGSFGEVDNYICGKFLQSDLNRKLAPAHRVQLGANATRVRPGAPVVGITTQEGDVMANTDPFIQASLAPWVGRGGNYPTLAAATNILPPTTVTAAAGAHASSKFVDGKHNGNYYYAVEAGNQRGRSGTLVKTAAEAVAGGASVTVTITPDAGSDATYFVIYRSRRNGSNANDDFREVTRVPKTAGGGNTVYIDHNTEIPGTQKLFIVENDPETVKWQRMADLTRYPLFPSAEAIRVWAHIWLGYLRVARPEHCYMIKNILTTADKARWDPFN